MGDFQTKEKMLQHSSPKDRPSRQTRKFAEQVVEAYLREVDHSERRSKVEEYYSNGKLFEAVELIAASNPDEEEH